MRRFSIWTVVIALLVGIGAGSVGLSLIDANSSNVAAKSYTKPAHTKKSAKRVFINASMNTDGTTSSMGKDLFGKRSYTQINLADYNIPQVGQGDGDFDKVWNQLKDADVTVIGTPVYWSNMSGYLKTFIDHMQISDDLKNSDLYVIVQGSDTNQSAAINSTYSSLNRIAKRFDLNFVGIAHTDKQINKLHNKMVGK